MLIYPGLVRPFSVTIRLNITIYNIIVLCNLNFDHFNVHTIWTYRYSSISLVILILALKQGCTSSGLENIILHYLLLCHLVYMSIQFIVLTICYYSSFTGSRRNCQFLQDINFVSKGDSIYPVGPTVYQYFSTKLNN